MKELWRKLKKTKYEVSDKGRIRNTTNLHILTPSIDKYGYYKLSLRDNSGENLYKTVHRLVAETWIDNPENLPQVNHKDGIKLHNFKDNLEWISASGNIIHSYETELNANANKVQLFDKKDLITKKFRSLKDLARFLNVGQNIILPLIKNSDNNPILGRYQITVLNEDEMVNKSNTIKFGRTVYVYDTITNSLKTYPSVLLASYHTGIRSLSKLNDGKRLLKIIGYYVSFDISEIPTNVSVDKDIVAADRSEYLNAPSRRQAKYFYVYDYYSKKEITFKSLSDITAYLNKIEPLVRIVTKSYVASALTCAANRSKTALIKGLGVRSDRYDYEWHQYNEEIIISNRKGNAAPIRIYEVTVIEKKYIISGMYELCKMFNYKSTKRLSVITHEEITKSLNNPNITIRRLNKPI